MRLTKRSIASNDCCIAWARHPAGRAALRVPYFWVLRIHVRHAASQSAKRLPFARWWSSHCSVSYIMSSIARPIRSANEKCHGAMSYCSGTGFKGRFVIPTSGSFSGMPVNGPEIDAETRSVQIGGVTWVRPVAWR